MTLPAILEKDELPENGCEAGRTGVRFQLSTNVELETEVFSVEQVRYLTVSYEIQSCC